MSSGLFPGGIRACAEPNCLTYLAPPNTRWAYHQGAYRQTGSLLENTVGLPLNAITNRYVEEPIGMKTGFWRDNASSGAVYWSRPRDAARFGHLILNGGVWGGDRVLRDFRVRKCHEPTQPDHEPQLRLPLVAQRL